MSAWVVSKAHINAMVDAGMHVHYRPFHWYPKGGDVGKSPTLTQETADRVGQMLLDECIASVSYRYDEGYPTRLPGKTNAEHVIPFQYKPLMNPPTPVEVLKIISCYEYQSCEHPQWEDSEAHCFCRALRKSTIDRLPGYDEAPWGWEDKEPAGRSIWLSNS